MVQDIPQHIKSPDDLINISNLSQKKPSKWLYRLSQNGIGQ